MVQSFPARAGDAQDIGFITLLCIIFHISHSFSDMLPSYIQPALHGAQGYPQFPGNPFRRMSMHVKAYHYLTVNPCKIPQFPTDGLQFFRGILFLLTLFRNFERIFLKTDLRPVVLLAEPVTVLIGKDCEKPRPQVVRLLPPGELADCGQKRLLGNILCCLGIPCLFHGGRIQSVNIFA